MCDGLILLDNYKEESAKVRELLICGTIPHLRFATIQRCATRHPLRGSVSLTSKLGMAMKNGVVRYVHKA